MDQPKMERLLRLMKLLTTNVGYTVDDLAGLLEINRRSVYRYLDTLESVGFVLQKTKGCFSLCVKSPFFKDISQLVHFTEEEAYLVNQLIESISDSNMVKRNLKQKLASVYNFRGVADSIVDGKNADNVRLLLEAIEGKRQVVLGNYVSSNSKQVRDRLVEPFAFTSNYLQVWCYEPASGMNKMFKVGRAEKVVLLDDAWTNEQKHQMAFIDVFRISAKDGVTYPVKLELNARAYNLLIEEYPLAKKYVVSVGRNRWLFDAMVSNYWGIGRFVLGLAADVKIVDSPELVEYVREYARNYILGR
ncbi:MAG: WYL domain-containing protein [Mediterranea massiliensis]|nr:WYL domain-containing protein [Mediterranea massiliensis]